MHVIVRFVKAPLELIKMLLRHRFLLQQLSRRFFAIRYSATSLGWLWALLSTAFQFALFLVIFSKLLGIRVAGPPEVNFGLYLMSGLVPFLALSDAAQRAVSVFANNAVLVQKVSFPADVLVVADTAAALAHHGIAFAVVVAVSVVSLPLRLVHPGWLLLGVALAVLWAVGLGLILSVAGALLPDLREVVALALQAAFYGAPIVYPMEMIHQPMLRTLVECNPVTGVVNVVRAGLIGGEPVSPTYLAVLATGGLLLVAAGAAQLAWLRPRLADVL